MQNLYVEEPGAVIDIKQPTNITFHGLNNEPYLEFDFKDGKLQIEYKDINEAGKVFFDFLKPFCDNYIQEQLKKW